MEASSNLSSLTSLDSLEGTISESDKVLMSGYINMSNQQNAIYKMHSKWERDCARISSLNVVF